jgi:ADP-heptose:LPS heptosyltransferase
MSQPLTRRKATIIEMTHRTDPFTAGFLSRLTTVLRKIVLIRASRIGDFLCTIPSIRALRDAFPEAEIAMITLPMLRDLAMRSPYIDRYIPFPGFPGMAEQFFSAPKAVQFFQQMQSEQIDLALQMQGSGVYSNPFMLLLGAKATAGFVREGDPAGLLDAALPFPENEHEIRRMLALTTFLGIPSQGEELEFPLWHEDYTQADALLNHTKPPLIGLHPSARDETRRWASDHFAETGRTLAQRYHGTIVLLGEAEDYPVGETMASAIATPCLNLMGKTTLPVLGAVIARLSVLITNDTGPAHIAYALQTPTVTIFGGGSPTLNGPLAQGPFRILLSPVPCRPCGYATCPIGYFCLEHVSVQEVIQSVEELL